MSKPIAFIIGAGKNIGASTTKALQANGYRVARGDIARQDDPCLNVRRLTTLRSNQPLAPSTPTTAKATTYS